MSSPSAWALGITVAERFSYLSKNSKFDWNDRRANTGHQGTDRGGTMDNWIDELAQSLGEAPLTSAETTQLLSAAGDVAHRVERKMTPLSTFVIGCAVGRRLASGADRTETLADTLRQLESLLPPQAPES
jgi:uncharacterized protein DUF6457